jgi:uncharacterized protein YxjI
MNQRLLSLGGRYDIRTDQDAIAWVARVRLFALSHTIELAAGDGRPMGRLRQRVMSFPGTWDLTLRETPGAVLKRAFRFVGGSLQITTDDGRHLHVEGDFLKREYVIEADGEVLALVSKRFFSLRDIYGIELARAGDEPEAEDLLPIAVALVVDQAHHEHG